MQRFRRKPFQPTVRRTSALFLHVGQQRRSRKGVGSLLFRLKCYPNNEVCPVGVHMRGSMRERGEGDGGRGTVGYNEVSLLSNFLARSSTCCMPGSWSTAPGPVVTQEYDTCKRAARRPSHDVQGTRHCCRGNLVRRQRLLPDIEVNDGRNKRASRE